MGTMTVDREHPAQRDHGWRQLGDVVPEVDDRGHVLLFAW